MNNKRLTDLMHKGDLDLLNLYVAEPKSQEALGAETVLRYRQYLAQKFYNKSIVVLTIVLALSTAAQAWLTWASRARANGQQAIENSLELKTEAHTISAELQRMSQTLIQIRMDHENDRRTSNIGSETKHQRR